MGAASLVWDPRAIPVLGKCTMEGCHNLPCLALQGLSYLVNASHQIGSKVFWPDSLASCGRGWHIFPGQAAQVMTSPGKAIGYALSQAWLPTSCWTLLRSAMEEEAQVSHGRRDTASLVWHPRTSSVLGRQAMEEGSILSLS